jgi:hypothetical protein
LGQTNSWNVEVVSGVGAKGTSYIPFGPVDSREPLGPDGAQRLADLICKAPPPMLESLDLRCPHQLFKNAQA